MEVWDAAGVESIGCKVYGKKNKGDSRIKKNYEIRIGGKGRLVCHVHYRYRIWEQMSVSQKSLSVMSGRGWGGRSCGTLQGNNRNIEKMRYRSDKGLSRHKPDLYGKPYEIKRQPIQKNLSVRVMIIQTSCMGFPVRCFFMKIYLLHR